MAINWGAVLGGAAPVLGAVNPVLGFGAGVLGAVSGGTVGAKNTLIGGQILESGGGRVKVRTTSGKIVVIKRQKHRRFHSRSRSSGLKPLMKQMMEYRMMEKVLK